MKGMPPKPMPVKGKMPVKDHIMPDGTPMGGKVAPPYKKGKK